jgi:hypothetical protein
MRPNTSNVQGYAFAMNTYANAMSVVPLARYEDRYARDIGKWLLNAASAARLFYGNAHGPGNQSSEFWTGDPKYSIAYEGLRHNWLPPHLLKPGESSEIYAAGDPLTYGWGPLTDFGIYGSAFTGVLASVIKTTNVEKVLQLDLLATDFYRAAAHPTYLYYNPHPADQSVAIELGNGAFDLYDAVSNRFLQSAASGATFFTVPKDNAVMLVLVPAGGAETMVGRKLLVDNVVVDYNAALLPDNLIANPDVDSPAHGSASGPASWHRGTNAIWANDVALSPTHSLALKDTSATGSDEWRTYATPIPGGEDRTLALRWFWKYDIAPGEEFLARLRLSHDEVMGADLVNATSEVEFLVSGSSAEFEMFETSVPVAAGIRSFNLTFLSGTVAGAIGSLFVDDISASLTTLPMLLAGDYNGDGAVDAADYVVWRDTTGQSGSGLAADGNGNQQIDQGDYDIWRAHFGRRSTGAAEQNATPRNAVPEPVGLAAILFTTMAAPLLTGRLHKQMRA